MYTFSHLDMNMLRKSIVCISEWQWSSVDNVSTHRQIISYFGDTLSPRSPFSIQKLISVARESGKKAGDWFGPASIANALRCDNYSVDFTFYYGTSIVYLCGLYRYD